MGDVIAAVVVVVATFVPYPGDELHPTGWAMMLLVIASAGVLPFRRRWPVPVLAVSLGFYAVAALTSALSPSVTLTVCIAVFGAANRSTRRATMVIGGSVVVVIVLLGMLAASGGVLDPLVFQFALAVAFAAAAGDGARTRRAYIEAITERAERAERTREEEAGRRVTEERLRIARDLHDVVAHQIAVVSLNAGVASSTLDANPERARTALGTIRQASRTALGEIGGLLSMLRADDPRDDGAPQCDLDHLGPLLARFQETGLDVRTHVDGDLSSVTGAVGLVAYRVIQEALTNAHKHGAENRAQLLLEISDRTVRIVVTNPVRDMATVQNSTATVPAGFGVGLIGLRERVTSVRGVVHAGPAPGGWTVTAAIPLPEKGSA
ncbi:signal transduction histidine kinase [Kibdelosporangium banguiense]|uniref:histidine kinase n=1 Tax=Kibdelosporangium banguiense TaxID=1365924 RepID=A0ABS4TYG3_9PSEU|nr:histidine kinase [Kibdelosporangium banguiense]MBP2329443.1 signal transduction histidine kinase [Kibdelosporangium banguiense]